MIYSLINAMYHVPPRKMNLKNYLINIGRLQPDDDDKNNESDAIKDEISEIENYFKSVIISEKQIKLNSHSTIIDIPLFLESHLSFIRENDNKKVLIPYLQRLQELRKVIENRTP